jgi:hypothetical protein
MQFPLSTDEVINNFHQCIHYSVPSIQALIAASDNWKLCRKGTLLRTYSCKTVIILNDKDLYRDMEQHYHMFVPPHN